MSCVRHLTVRVDIGWVPYDGVGAVMTPECAVIQTNNCQILYSDLITIIRKLNSLKHVLHRVKFSMQKLYSKSIQAEHKLYLLFMLFIM